MKWSSVIFAVGRSSHVDIVATVYTYTQWMHCTTQPLNHSQHPLNWQLVMLLCLFFADTVVP